MQQQVSNPKTTASDASRARRSQVIFMIVGVAIIVGGLWFIYEGDAPYHPDAPVAEVPIPQMVDS